MTYKRDLAEYRRLRKKLHAALVDVIKREVAPFLVPYASYCGLVCEFFPEQRRARDDVRHPRERSFKSPDRDFNSIIGFTADGVIPSSPSSRWPSDSRESGASTTPRRPPRPRKEFTT